MSNQFDWHVGDMDEESVEPIPANRSGRVTGPLLFVIATALIAAALVAVWQVSRSQLSRSEKKLREQVQTILDLEHEAAVHGDGELFFSIQADEPGWFVAQLLPENQAVSIAGAKVTRVQSHDDFVWANVSWSDATDTWQRVAFFEWQEEQLVHAASDDSYWGRLNGSKQMWGELVYHEVDEPWASLVAVVVEDLVARTCADGCPAGRRPFILRLTSEYAKTAAPNEIRMPSPRLVALTEEGRPGLPFWRQLEREVTSYLQPATIRFAVPPPDVRDGAPVKEYPVLAARFMVHNPDINVELVFLEELPDDLASVAAEYDGAAIRPTEEILAAGLVLDLTDYIETDPDFNEADFYEQVWQGAEWQGRIWMIPQAAYMRLIFYDRFAYREAGLSEPSLRWTWSEMARDITSLMAAQPESSSLEWGFLDIDLDSLLSYAYNWNNQCQETATVLCRNPLQTDNVAAAFDWYKQMLEEPGRMPDLTGLTLFERQHFLLNTQGARRETAIWVDKPANYENQLLLANLGVVPFPGSDRFDGITPLWVQGSFISQHTEHPRAVWQWLKFLSEQRPSSRLIPARPSVSDSMQYWEVLPHLLGNAMRTAFPFARPVTFSEQTYLSWERLSAVMAGDLSPIEAAQQMPEIDWFRAPVAETQIGDD